ncbi:adenosylmethionine decarboxylase [Desulfatitalea alkaliphila]|uniref:S-adenosylmethionine decarboxylase proenzyme n=1 Tax=Desulfatitalea alkaliphila TaxID=2929485 RepID=A0AA41R2T9_9BACT|nr:adenosylmethionine decarboxylase [Desulfatitalea alkaliphila]MCJ8501099.1 adenosylmethionine decarboxylase [Desulfatitalea alkaliphila]
MNQTTGKHCILELFECPSELLDDEQFICRAINSAAEASGSTLLTLSSHKFSPQGVTALGLLAESHISIHTWPETGYAAVDAFTCGTHCDPVAACRLLTGLLEAKRQARTVLQRGRGVPLPVANMASNSSCEDTCIPMRPPAAYG